MSWRQSARQDAREQKSGRYRTLNPCERCKKSSGADYYSDERCNTIGPGLILCGGCAELLAAVPDSEYESHFRPRPTRNP